MHLLRIANRKRTKFDKVNTLTVSSLEPDVSDINDSYQWWLKRVLI